MSSLHYALLWRIVTNIVVIGAPLVAAFDSHKGELPGSVVYLIAVASVIVKTCQSILDLKAPAK
jgi:hypothetical protein